MPDRAKPIVWRNLTKEQFLDRNRAALAAIVASVNVRLVESYGAAATSLTTCDVWVLTYIEAGITNGKVDPNFRHSLGERGLLPLPANVAYWNGPGAPNPNQPMALAVNLDQFFLYLGQLENKRVVIRNGLALYRDLFKWQGIAGDAERQAKLLAGVVHGYFYSGNYRDRRPPIEKIMARYVEDLPVDAILADTTYVHAGSSILVNRQRNIEKAIALHG